VYRGNYVRDLEKIETTDNASSSIINNAKRDDEVI